MSFVPLVCAEFLCFCLKSFLDDLVCVDLLPFAIRIQCSWWVWESWWLCLILVCRLLSLVAMVRLLGFRSLWINSWSVHWCWSHNCLVIWVAFGSSWLTGRLIIYLCTVVYFILFLFFYDDSTEVIQPNFLLSLDMHSIHSICLSGSNYAQWAKAVEVFFMVERSSIIWLMTRLLVLILNILIKGLRMHKLEVVCGTIRSPR